MSVKQELPTPGEVHNLPFLRVTDPQELRLRSQRHALI
jgi:hypothetical protein